MGPIRTIPSSWFRGCKIAILVTGGIQMYRTLELLQHFYSYEDLQLQIAISESETDFLPARIAESFVHEFTTTESVFSEDFVNEFTQNADALLFLDFRDADDPLQSDVGFFSRLETQSIYVHMGADVLGELFRYRIHIPDYDWAYLMEAIASFLSPDQTWQGRSILVTASRTEEDIDPIRFISNRSTGKMGFALARQASLRGANVILVTGPTTLRTPYGVFRKDVRTADEMLRAAEEEMSNIQALFASAAVEDMKPIEVQQHKIKKSGAVTIECESAVDVLKRLSEKRMNQYLLGFSVETENELENSLAKMESKALDAIVINNPREKASAFQHDTNKATILTRQGNEIWFPLLSKDELASRILGVVSDEMKTYD